MTTVFVCYNPEDIAAESGFGENFNFDLYNKEIVFRVRQIVPYAKVVINGLFYGPFGVSKWTGPEMVWN